MLNDSSTFDRTMPDVLTLRQLAEHLQLSERTIYRLLGRGQLPGFKVGGHWRFRRSVVDYWLDLRIGRMSPADLEDIDTEWLSPACPLSDALAIENALLTISGGSRQEIVAGLIRAVTFAEPVDVEQVVARVWEREQLASTAASDGVALLHTARWDVRAIHRHDLLAIGRLSTPIDFGEADGKLTDIFFLVLARDARRQLTLLAKAARLCRHDGFLAALRAAGSPRSVVTLVRNTERVLFTSQPPSNG